VKRETVRKRTKGEKKKKKEERKVQEATRRKEEKKREKWGRGDVCLVGEK
jgi:hypothetical protein